MKRSLTFTTVLVALVTSYSFIVSLRASIPQVPSQTWTATGDAVTARSRCFWNAPARWTCAHHGRHERRWSDRVSRAIQPSGRRLPRRAADARRARESRRHDSSTAASWWPVAWGLTATRSAPWKSTIRWRTCGRPLGRCSTRVRVIPRRCFRWPRARRGGDDSGVPTGALEVFDPSIEGFSLLEATLSVPRMGHAARCCRRQGHHRRRLRRNERARVGRRVIR
jgi:hypothetical protein